MKSLIPALFTVGALMVCLVQSEAYSNLIEYYYSNITNESYNKMT